MTAAESSTDRAVGEVDLFFDYLMGLIKDRGQFSLQSIKSQSVRHGSLSSVDSSSFPIVWDGKSPSCLSGEWRATMSVRRVWMAQKTRNQDAFRERTEYPTPTFTASRSSKASDFFGFLNLLRDSGGNFTACIWQSETKLSSVSLMGLEIHAPSPTSTYSSRSSDPTERHAAAYSIFLPPEF